MKRYLRFLQSKQEGFTFLEILIAALISSVLAAGIVVTIYQIYNQNNRATRNMVVTQNVESAGYWVSRDALMAQNVPTTTFPLYLEWQDWDGNSCRIAYSLSDGILQRTVFVNAVATSQTAVARNINTDPELTGYTYTNRVLNFKVTATIDSYSESRNYEITLRAEPLPE